MFAYLDVGLPNCNNNLLLMFMLMLLLYLQYILNIWWQYHDTLILHYLDSGITTTSL